MNDALATCMQRLDLVRRPFPPVPDAQAYFQTPLIERELEEMAHFLRSGSGIVLLTGEVGTGKTTFLRRLLEMLEQGPVVSSMVFNTFLRGAELLAAILHDFGLRPTGAMSADIEALNAFLLESRRAGKCCVVIVDDAQNFDADSLELVRLLTNLETGQEKLLQIVLAGQPELCDTLSGRNLRQLASRIAKHVRMEAFDRELLGSYVRFRLAEAGAGHSIVLADGGLTELFRVTGGNPRRVHAVMDRCLYGLIACDRRVIDAALVAKASSETGMSRSRSWALTLPRMRMSEIPKTAYASLGAAAVGLVLAAALQSASLDVAANARPDLAPPQASVQWNDCLSVLAGADADGAPGVTTHVARVDTSWALRLGSRGDVCIDRDWNGWVVAWNGEIDPGRFFGGPDSRESVRKLQAWLASARYYDAERDGLYGPQTHDAVAGFQRDNRLPATGIVDALTLLYIDTPAAALAAGQSGTQPGTKSDG